MGANLRGTGSCGYTLSAPKAFAAERNLFSEGVLFCEKKDGDHINFAAKITQDNTLTFGLSMWLSNGHWVGVAGDAHFKDGLHQRR